MKENSTILLKKEIIELLKKAKEYPRQTYDEIIKKMASLFIKIKERNQYDKFLHEIQKDKMKEIWDNKEDKAWENA